MAPINRNDIHTGHHGPMEELKVGHGEQFGYIDSDPTIFPLKIRLRDKRTAQAHSHWFVDWTPRLEDVVLVTYIKGALAGVSPRPDIIF